MKGKLDEAAKRLARSPAEGGIPFHLRREDDKRRLRATAAAVIAGYHELDPADLTPTDLDPSDFDPADFPEDDPAHAGEDT